MTRRAVCAVALFAVLFVAAAQNDDCPLIDGASACVPVLGACESCNPQRGGGDAVCSETLVCDPEDSVCRGVDVNDKCGDDSGKECDEGLYCQRLRAGWRSGRQEERCFIAGAEGDVCETSDVSSLPDAEVDDPRFRRGCAQGLLCYDGGDGRGAVCYRDDGRQEFCENNVCSRVDEVCKLDEVSRRVCRRVVRLGESCEPGVSECSSGQCVEGDDGDGFKCRILKGVAVPCGGSSVCRRDSNAGFDVTNLRCEAGYCAEDERPGGLFQLCGSDTDCDSSTSASAAGMVCAMAQDGNRRCLNIADKFDTNDWSLTCAISGEYARTQGLPTVTCPAGYECKKSRSFAQRGLGLGWCKPEALAQVGEACIGGTSCVEDDGEGRSLICSASSAGPPRCLRRLRDGESCSTDNGVCDTGDQFANGCVECDRLRAASCDESNICRVSSDETCTDDNECDSSTGKTCVSAIAVSSLGSKTCYNYNRQIGESCTSDIAFNSLWREACADGLICLENSPARNSIDGTCVKLAEDGERCNPDEGLVCAGRTVNVRSVCNNGTCRPLALPR